MIRSVSEMRKLMVKGSNEIANAAHQPPGHDAGRAMAQTIPATIGPASSRLISCQAGGSGSAGLNQV
jgi:hypothetical protein